VPLCVPYQRRLPPRHSAAHRHRRLHFGQRPPGEDAASPPLRAPRPSSRHGTPPRRRW
jgi:hypothetical protein